jgi:enoyl-CoA hydratase/carnithine racemase/acyl-CoA reductase-like NAD-dependent aldehyde dehydrogenase
VPRETTHTEYSRCVATPSEARDNGAVKAEADAAGMVGHLVSRIGAAARRWRRLPIRERLDVLRVAGATLHQRRQDLLECLRADGLSTVLAEYYGAWIERQGSAELLEHNARELLRGTPATHETLVRRPDGVVALITPGNSPTINTAPLFSILLAGNGVLMRAPASDGGVRLIAAECIGAALEAAGHAPDLVQVVTGKTRPLLEAIYADEGVDTIVFFGNAVAGEDVAREGHRAGKKVVLELEGSDCMIVWRDADLDAALASAMHGFDFSTQPCPVPKHFLVHPEVEPAFVEGLRTRAGALRTVEVDPERGVLVPLMRPEGFNRFVVEARRRGEIVLGGHRMDAAGVAADSAPYGAPTLVVVDDGPDLAEHPLFRHEINVPVLPVVRYRGSDADILASMIDLVDRMPFGLRASVWTRDSEVASEVVRSLGKVGLVLVNADHAQHPSFLSPWGGPKRSGGPHGESHLFWQKTTHLQGVVASPAVVREALLGSGGSVLLDVRDEIAWVTLHRPERHNAVDSGMAEALSDVLEELVARADALRGVVLRGAGSSFCSGADLRMLERLGARAARRFMQEVTWSLRQLERLPVPSLALVRGYCVGGGLEFALHCDEIVAAQSARFALPEVRHGYVTTAGAIGRVAHAVGRRRAAAWLLSGEPVTASAAEAAGLVARVVADDQLDDAAQQWCERVRRLPPSGLIAAKRLLRTAGVLDTWPAELEAFEEIVRERDNHD